jgi:hypothetical protein
MFPENQNEDQLSVKKMPNDKSQSLIISPNSQAKAMNPKPMTNENLDNPTYHANAHLKKSIRKSIIPIVIDEPNSIE